MLPRDEMHRGLERLDIRPGDTLLVHSSLKSLGHVEGGAAEVIASLAEYLTPAGTLLMPALTYRVVTRGNPVFDLRHTPSNVGLIPETFRKTAGVKRSMHPTHSVCGLGPGTSELLEGHEMDRTPCGLHSPFAKLARSGGKILMLGCGLLPNTMMHAIEELVVPEYLFGKPIRHTLIDGDGRTIEAEYTPHSFAGWRQRYDRVNGLRTKGWLLETTIGRAVCHGIRAGELWEHALERLGRDPFSFVERL